MHRLLHKTFLAVYQAYIVKTLADCWRRSEVIPLPKGGGMLLLTELVAVFYY
jgi:hypothetical protein